MMSALDVSVISVAESARILTFEEGDYRKVELLGGKGAGLVRMTAARLPVPPGFIITTEVCRERQRDGHLPSDLAAEVSSHVHRLEKRMGRSFGCGAEPLLISVRSGAPVSMPGMMDTILNLGMNAETTMALARETSDPIFAATTFVRFQHMYGEIVLGAEGEVVDRAAAPVLAMIRDNAQGAWAEQLAEACRLALLGDCGSVVPSDTTEQLMNAIEAVFESLYSRRAVSYRNFHGIRHELGTAVVVQTMVFGNLGSPSGAGVAFSRDPLTGDPTLFGEFLEGAQGEDVVAGTTTPQKIAEATRRFPALFAEFADVARGLEDLYRDVVDIEFTVERGKLYILQVRSAKRSAQAALRFASDFIVEGRLTEAAALRSVSLAQVREIERPAFDAVAVATARSQGRLLGVGIGACPGQTSGRAILDPDRAEAAKTCEGGIILVRPTTSPHDLHGMIAASGILTSLGGATSHAAVVARALNKPGVVGCKSLEIDAQARRFRFDQVWYEEGTELSIDGGSGDVFAGVLPVTAPAVAMAHIRGLFAAADSFARCRVVAHVAVPAQVKEALESGATGIAVRLGDVLTASGRLQDFIDAVLAPRQNEADVRRMVDMLADTLAPLLDVAGGSDFWLRAIDLSATEAAELLQTNELLAREPRLALPVGVPALIEAQVRGLALARERTAYRGNTQLSVRHVTDPCEMREIARLTNAVSPVLSPPVIPVGATLTSLRGALMASEIGREANFLWLEARSLLASGFGFSAAMMLTAEPLDDYVRRGLLSVDPRTSLDEPMTRAFLSVAAAAVHNADCRVGVRLPGTLSEEMIASLYRIGFRTFAVDLGEVRPARIALGKESSR